MSAYPDTKHRSYTKGRKGIIPLMSNLVKLCSITVWIHECENTDLKKAFTHTYIVDIAVSLFLSAKIKLKSFKMKIQIRIQTKFIVFVL